MLESGRRTASLSDIATKALKSEGVRDDDDDDDRNFRSPVVDDEELYPKYHPSSI
jgi:hypothetical protein